MTARHLALCASLLLLAGCARGCDASLSAPTLTIAATTTTSIVVSRPGAPWRATLVVAEPGSAAPTLAPDAAFAEAWSCQWQTADGAHQMRLRADTIALNYDPPRNGGVLFFTESTTGGLLLLPFGVALPFEGSTPPSLETTRWHGELGEGALEVVSWRAGDEQTFVVLRDGAPLDHRALGGSLSSSSSSGDGGLKRLQVTSPALTFVLEWPDPDASEVSTTVQLDGRPVPVTLQRLAPGQRPTTRG